MKKILLFSILSSLCILAVAQVQQGINYQAVAFNSSGLPIVNTTLQVKAGILSDTLPTVIVWEELHSSVKTNYSGVFNLVIGTGTKQAGSAVAFNSIDWSVSPLYLKIQIFYQNSWKYMGTARLWSVPRAMVAGDIEGPVKKLTINGETDINDEPLFEVKNRTGQTVFAVYNEGVRIYVDDGAKGTKGGFAVGGFGTDKAPSQNLLYISNDSIRAYIDAAPGKGTKGGFAVGGFDATKTATQDLLVVSGDSIRAYINDSGKGVKGGFAVGGFDASKGLADNYMLINGDSTRFYLHELAKGESSTFNIVGINADQTQRVLMTANKDTVGIGAVLNVRNNLNVTGDIGYTGNVSLIVPEVYAFEPFNITDAQLMIMSEVMSDGGSPILARGVVWSTSPNPTVALPTRTVDGTAQGMLTSTVTGLTAGTTYYVRAYATNANGTGYSEEIIITTPLAGSTVTDIDGNVYNTVVIGTQTWMAQNLKTTRLNTGGLITNIPTDALWMTASGVPAYCWYGNDAVTYADYGLLYNWTAVDTGNLCPAGWHVPSDAEWSTLSTFLGGSIVAGGKLKETGTAHWMTPNQDATDEVGFTALPGGFRSYMGPFQDVGMTGNWWTSTMISVDPANVIINYGTGELMISQGMALMGHSVRCIKG